MTINSIRLTFNNPPLFLGLVLAEILTTINSDVLVYSVLGAVGALIGQIIYLAKRARADTENKLKMFSWKDAFFTTGFMLAGSFFSLVLSLPDVPEKILFLPTPIIAILVSPFMVFLWDVLEKQLPAMLTSFLNRYDEGKKKKNGETDTKENKAT